MGFRQWFESIATRDPVKDFADVLKGIKPAALADADVLHNDPSWVPVLKELRRAGFTITTNKLPGKTLDGVLIIAGLPENVKELKAIYATSSATEFSRETHARIGRLLGYPEEKITAWIDKNIR